ncbi:ADP-L-glycero-D-manno-heptose-6-epimerase [Candidatus Methanobinarius endosymbioticus]|uniref:ADP-L-glycero-D-manno-heptose-6-epimerase n=1 Tax=Candidatus Methanobinarius endosymbioticus TaxID=2006182 RepID=A0A366M9N5_9EURY|nr:ADP-L-glycero-D-manno-heptose-6-epimerase [Candidatus Methanobinarius endosymbioticus]
MILITGGAGYIGAHVNKKLHKEGFDTIVLDNLSHGHEHAVKWGEFFEVDLADSESINSIFDKFDIEGVMHFAAFTSVVESIEFPTMYFKNNYKNTLKLLKIMKEHSVDKFIFSSTAAVYGNPKKIPIVENSPINPINPYGKSKLMVENILKRESELKSSNFRYSSLRYFNAAGADPECEIGEDHDPETHLIPLILDVALGKKEKITIFGDNYDTLDGTCIRDYIHVNDLAQAHIKAFNYITDNKFNRNNNGNDFNNDSDNNSNNNFNNNSVFNIGNGNGFSVKEVIDVCERITGEKINQNISKRREGDPPILVADSKKAKNMLNWDINLSDLAKIIETAWNWHKKKN